MFYFSFEAIVGGFVLAAVLGSGLAACAERYPEERLSEERLLVTSLPVDDARFLYEANEATGDHVAVSVYFATTRPADDVVRSVARELEARGCQQTPQLGPQGAAGPSAAECRYRCGDYEFYVTLMPEASAGHAVDRGERPETVYSITATWREGPSGQ